MVKVSLSSKTMFKVNDHSFSIYAELHDISIFNYSGLATKCEYLQRKAENGFIGSFVPECDEKGRFLTVQCWKTVGQCWCVDNEGRELEGTRVEGSTPNCQAGI